jgi:hypothetical protein
MSQRCDKHRYSHVSESSCRQCLIDEQADTIAQLQEQVSKWIPVSERLPEDASIVVVAGGCAHYSSSLDQWFTNMEQDIYGNPRRISWDVIHWMPLPEPPKGGK